MILIYKKAEVNIYKLLCKLHDVALTANDTAAYTPCSRPHRMLILTDILPKFSQINLKIMYILKIA